ncbi:MAG: hypothetical protein LLF93_06925 [Bacteroidales bacterium]|nr:hypothetical protein [Bacteroidales bacterium]
MKNLFKSLIIFSLLIFQLNGAIAAPVKRAVAIVVDKTTYENCRQDIELYSQSVSAEGLNAIVIVDKWGVPDSIKVRLLNLYQTQNLEGTVLIGDIPVPMIRDAHHLATAFKMNPSRPWQESSIPSDRFYDDFDLKFNYLKRDTLQPLYYYYSLAGDGPQVIECDIYSARIKAPATPGKTKYQLISEYLQKVVKEKANRHKMNQISYYAGHGYNSDCMVARIDEKYSLMEQFRFLGEPQRSINYIDYTYDDNVKHRLLSELSRTDLDLAILHHHGSEDGQMMNGSPISPSTDVWLSQARKFFRGKIRNSSDTTASKQYYIDNYNVPKSWVSDAFNPELTKSDSLADLELDINIPDLYDYKSNAKIILFDACFNGSFHLDDYISGHYIFNSGSTIIVKANSVNTLQDTWTNQLLGLLDLGVSVGNWAKGQQTLESHLIGDPTYMFISSSNDKLDLNQAVTLHKGDIKFWCKQMANSNPEIKSLAMKMLSSNNAITTDELLTIQKEEMRPTVRLQAFNLLKNYSDKNFISSIKLGLYDNYELIRRLSSMYAAKNGSPELIDDVFTLRFQPGVSKRVEFQLKGASEIYSRDLAIAAYEKALNGKEGKWYERCRNQISSLKYNLDNGEKEYAALLDPKTPVKAKKFTISALRNSCEATHLDILFKFFAESDNVELKSQLAEAFGWYRYSYKKNEIIRFCKDQVNVQTDDILKKELVKTINRLELPKLK